MTMRVATRGSKWGWDEQADGWGINDPETLVDETVKRFEQHWKEQGFRFDWYTRTGEVHSPVGQEYVEPDVLLASMEAIREEIWNEFIDGKFDVQ